MGQYQTFIVRLWTGEGDEVPRGHIQHIASRRGAYFTDATRMLQFIREHLQPAELPALGESDGLLADLGLSGRSGADDR